MCLMQRPALQEGRTYGSNQERAEESNTPSQVPGEVDRGEERQMNLHL